MTTTSQPTTVTCIKGRIRELGPSLELAAAGFVYVGRRMSMGGWRLPESPWANPFAVKSAGSPEAAVQQYALWLAEDLTAAELRTRLPELRGRTLCCWCAEGQPCHAGWLAGLCDRASLASLFGINASGRGRG